MARINVDYNIIVMYMAIQLNKNECKKRKVVLNSMKTKFGISDTRIV